MINISFEFDVILVIKIILWENFLIVPRRTVEMLYSKI